ncbi:MAG: L-2-amino-thiazoline-4-carboxylic acid hydrolase [Clostridiales bacterium]|nr:L-2-amino-thiazoline-4-carboxylic acid hydrolase [Clostridiales bacterium]
MKRLLAKKYGRKAAGEYIRKAKPIYRQMLAQAEDIGAKNPMAHNIYMSFVFMAIWKAADGAITPGDMRSMTRDLLELNIVQKVMGGLDVNKPKDMDKFRVKLRKCAEWIENHPEYQDRSWDFHHETPPLGTGIFYYFTRCPLNDYARAYGYLEILPVMCELDYRLAGLYHARLYRKQTLAGGGSICDYWYVGDREPEYSEEEREKP